MKISPLRSAALALAIALGIANTGALALAQSSTTIPSGSQLNAVLSSPDINTKSAQLGDTFTMRVVAPFPNDNQALADATIDGHISAVRAAGQGRTAELTLALDRLHLPNGSVQTLHAYVQNVTETKENTVARKGLGAGVGAAVGSQTIGRIIGGNLGKIVGIGGGAAAGYAYANNMKPNVNVAKNAKVVVALTRSVTISRRQASHY